MNVSELQAGILSGNLTNEDLNALFDTLLVARQRLATKAKHSLRVGSNVTWTSSDGTKSTGVVTKVGVKFANVKVANWRGRANTEVRVPLNMLVAA